MTKTDCAGPYTLYKANWTIPGHESHAARMDVLSGLGEAAVVDDFNHAVKLPGACQPLRVPPESKCTTMTVSTVLPTKTPSPTPLPFVESEHTSAVASPPSPTPSAGMSRPLPGSQPHKLDLGFLTAAKGFFGSLVSDLAGFFG